MIVLILIKSQGRIPDVTLKCILYVQEKYNVGVSVEVEKPAREGLKELAAKANVVFYSKSWAQV
jgi:ketohexokinase